MKLKHTPCTCTPRQVVWDGYSYNLDIFLCRTCGRRWIVNLNKREET